MAVRRNESRPFTGRRMETKGSSEASCDEWDWFIGGGLLYFRLLIYSRVVRNVSKHGDDYNKQTFAHSQPNTLST